MADEVRHFTATIAAGTAIAAPAVTDISFPPRTVARIDWRMPPGASGTTGWRLTMGGVQVLPFGPDLWIIDDDHHDTFVPDGYPDSGAWQVTGYNTGVNAHSIYLTFHLNLIRRSPALRVPLDPRAVMPVPDASAFGRPAVPR